VSDAVPRLADLILALEPDERRELVELVNLKVCLVCGEDQATCQAAYAKMQAGADNAKTPS
jgi:hypothetical protein